MDQRKTFVDGKERLVPNISHMCFAGNSEPGKMSGRSQASQRDARRHMQHTPIGLEQVAKIKGPKGVIKRSWRRFRSFLLFLLLVGWALAHCVALSKENEDLSTTKFSRLNYW